MKRFVPLFLLSLFSLAGQSKPMDGVHLKLGTSTPSAGPHGQFLIAMLDELSDRLGFTYDYLNHP
ncbi:MAG: hypothetical protein PQJ60_00395, partial [Spirochaetales bacterium]|nr:hypothetical protein [Spirochaetales bacterium]